MRVAPPPASVPHRFAAGLLGAALLALANAAPAAPCLLVTLTGTQGGPPAYEGLAGAGTLVRYEIGRAHV